MKEGDSLIVRETQEQQQQKRELSTEVESTCLWTRQETVCNPSGNYLWQNDRTHGTQLAALCNNIPYHLQRQIKAGDSSNWDVTLIHYAFTELSNYIRCSLTSTIINNADDKLAKKGKNLRNNLNHKAKLSALSDADYNWFLNKFKNFFFAAGYTQFEWNEMEKEIMSYGQSHFEMDIKFAELEGQADECIKDKKYKEALEVYNKMLQLSDLSREKKSATYASRSSVCLYLKDEKYFTQAKQDAESAIELWPSWWRGYFALGKAFIELNQLMDAEEAFTNAHTLDNSLKEITDELNSLRRKIGIFSRYDHFIPDFQPLSQTPEEYARKLLEENNLDPSLFETAMKTDDLAIIVRGDQFRDGNGVQQDYSQALGHYTEAANKGLPLGMLRLGKLYEEGKGVAVDYDQMRILYERAANCKKELPGVAEAQHYLGVIYLDGVRVPKNFAKAAQWFEISSSNSYSPATNNLGVMYLNGYGVEKSLEKAFYFFKMAAEQGETAAMINLANYYFSAHGVSPFPTVDEIAEGKKWLTCAAENGNMLAQLQLKEFESTPPAVQMFGTIHNLFKAESMLTACPLDEQFREPVQEAVNRGSTTAKHILEIWDNMQSAVIAFQRDDHWKACENMSVAIRLNYEIVKIPSFMETCIKDMALRYPDNNHIITCLVHLDNTLIEQHFGNFKDDEHFQLMKIVHLINSENKSEALSMAQECVNRNSSNLWFLYLRAVTTEEIPLINEFLKSAPPDHSKVPEIHYYKALLFTHKNMIPSFFESFEAGLHSEKSQLPCFLPYKYPFKETLNLDYQLKKDPEQIPKIREEVIKSLKEVKAEWQRTGNESAFLKKMILQHHRKCYVNENPVFLQTTRKPHALSPRRSFVNLKKIVLKDIYQSQPQSQPLFGYILEARIIDWAVGSPNIFIVIEDENGGTARALICNTNITLRAQFMKYFRPNSIISINGPLMQYDADGEIYILIESPTHFHLDNTDTQKRCYVCNKEGNVHSCKNCHMTLYCSADCEKLDWTEFDHKSVCAYFKNLAENYESLKN